MIGSGLEGVLATFPPISLAETQNRAEFMTRKDRKYLLPVDLLGDLLHLAPEGTSVMEIDGQRLFRYHSIYFDEADRSAYLAGLRRRPNRFKVRTRHYVDSDLRLLEVKTMSARGETVKTRIAHDCGDLTELSDTERDWLAGFDQVRRHVDGLLPCLSTTYQRATFVLPEDDGRVTIDLGLTWGAPGSPGFAVGPYAVIETKGTGKATAIDQALWRMGIRPVPMSKFAVGLSILNPELPANRWNRLRNRLTAELLLVEQPVQALNLGPG